VTITQQQTTFLWPPPNPDRQRACTLKELPTSEHPAYRLDHYGAPVLSNTELLAILIGTQLQLTDAAHLLVHYKTLSALSNAPILELARFPGVGAPTACRIKAALALADRIRLETGQDLPQVRSPADAANLLIPTMSNLEQEHLVALCLDTKNHVIAQITVAIGSLNCTHVQVATFFRQVIRINAAGVIVAHNHPSGDSTPSPDDVAITRQLVDAGKLLDVDVLDHLIIGGQRFISLKERGLGFS
jgi:DNA repair protein RadC